MCCLGPTAGKPVKPGLREEDGVIPAILCPRGTHLPSPHGAKNWFRFGGFCHFFNQILSIYEFFQSKSPPTDWRWWLGGDRWGQWWDTLRMIRTPVSQALCLSDDGVLRQLSWFITWFHDQWWGRSRDLTPCWYLGRGCAVWHTSQTDGWLSFSPSPMASYRSTFYFPLSWKRKTLNKDGARPRKHLPYRRGLLLS